MKHLNPANVHPYRSAKDLYTLLYSIRPIRNSAKEKIAKEWARERPSKPLKDFFL